MITYEIRILDIPDGQMEHIDRVLGVKSLYRIGMWRYKLIWLNNCPETSFVDHFLAILNGKYEQLESIGITRDMISFWLLYEYDQQCNLEFNPEELRKTGQEGITLCISCWEK